MLCYNIIAVITAHHTWGVRSRFEACGSRPGGNGGVRAGKGRGEGGRRVEEVKAGPKVWVTGQGQTGRAKAGGGGR
jgi:hypothetical protein